VNPRLRLTPGLTENSPNAKGFESCLDKIASAVGRTIPFVCQDWANTKAAYRFFSNEPVDEIRIGQRGTRASPPEQGRYRDHSQYLSRSNERRLARD
jgi:hypothetical protein